MIENKIIEVFKSSGLTRVEFADKLQISNAVLSHLASGRNKASLDLVVSLLNHFPKISTDWLLLNKGEMYRTDFNNLKTKENMQNHILKIKENSQAAMRQLNLMEKEIDDLK